MYHHMTIAGLERDLPISFDHIRFRMTVLQKFYDSLILSFQASLANYHRMEYF